MKYLISSKLYPNVNGVYERRHNNNYLYHNSNTNYKLYYNSETLTWNIGVLGSTPLYTSKPTSSIDIFRVEWEDKTISITSLSQDATSEDILVKTRVNDLLSQSQCGNCNLYVCCCDLEDEEKSDLDVAKAMLDANRVNTAEKRSESGIIKIENASGFYTIARGSGSVEAQYRVEFNSVTKNRYGHIDFKIEKRDEATPVVLEITDSHQFYSEKTATALTTSEYLIFTHIRVIKYNDSTYKIELFYNRNAFKDSTIVGKVIVKNVLLKQWDPVGFLGPNVDTNYWTCMPPLSVDSMFTRVTGRSTFMIDKNARTGIDIQKPVAKLDMYGSIRSTADNPYVLDKWRHVDKNILKENDVILLSQNSLTTLNSNKGFYGSVNYNEKRLHRLRCLGDITIYFDGRKVLAQFTITSVTGAPICTAGLNTTGVNVGDYVMTRYTLSNSSTYNDIRKVIGIDTNNNIVIEKGFTQIWWNSSSTSPVLSTAVNFHSAKIYHIYKNTKLSGTVSAINTTLKGTGTAFTSELIAGDTLILVSPLNIITREIVRIKSDNEIEIDNTVGSSLITDIFIIKIPSQFVLQDNNKNPNMVVRGDGSLQLGGDLLLLGTGNSASSGGAKLSMTTGTVDFKSNTMASNGTSSSQNSYTTGANAVDFVELDGNLKVDGVTKFTDNIYFCSQTNDSPAAPEITALIDTDLGDIRLKGSVVSSRLVASNTQVVNLVATNVFSQNNSIWSDARLKEDVENIGDNTEVSDNILNKINELNPVTFKWKGTGVEDVGFIGQELESVFPDVVESSADGVLSVHYNRLLTYMIVAMKQMINKD